MASEPGASEADLLERLRAGNEQAFGSLVDSLNCRLVSLAGTFTSSPALAEDIVQETWLGVIRGLRNFEGRSSLKTWIFSILVRRARTMAAREARRPEIPLLHGESDGESGWEPGHGRLGLWEGRPQPWGPQDPATLFQNREVVELMQRALGELPERQRRVVILRDLEDVSAGDTCNILEISETYQRVLLHRGRARIRHALDRWFQGGTSRTPLTETRVATTPMDGGGQA